MIDTFSRHWAHRPPVELTPAEARLLRLVLHGRPADGVEPWTLYSGAASPRTDTSRRRALQRLEPTGVVEVFLGVEMGWDASMWGARLTCLGANSLYRFDGDVHTECPALSNAPWAQSGTCTGCSRPRPLDAEAYRTHLAALSPFGYCEQVNGPQLYCAEHGWVRKADVNSMKVCRLEGTVFHDGGLDRV